MLSSNSLLVSLQIKFFLALSLMVAASMIFKNLKSPGMKLEKCDIKDNGNAHGP